MHNTNVRFTITAVDHTQQALKRVQTNFRTLSRSVSCFIAPLAAITGSAGFGAMIKQSIDAGDKIQKLSQRLGASTEALSQYQYVAQRSGVSFDNFTSSLEKLQRNISQATIGMGKAHAALKALNLSAKELIKLKPEAQYERIAEALSHVSNQGDKIRLNNDLMGMASTENLQIMAQGAQGIAELRAEADKLGLTLSQNAADSMAAANDAITKLGASVRGLANTLAIQLAPALVQAIDLFQQLTSFYGQHKNAPITAGLAQMLTKVAQGFNALKPPAWLEDAHENLNKKLITYSLIAQALTATKEQTTSLGQDTTVINETITKIQNLTDSSAAYQAVLREGQQLTQSLRTPLEIYHEQLSKLDELLQHNAISQQAYTRAIKAYGEQLKSTVKVSKVFEQQQRSLEKYQQQFSLIFSQGLFAFMEDGFDSMANNFERALKRMAAMAASIELGQLLFGGADIGGLLGNLFKAAPTVTQS